MGSEPVLKIFDYAAQSFVDILRYASLSNTFWCSDCDQPGPAEFYAGVDFLCAFLCAACARKRGLEW